MFCSVLASRLLLVTLMPDFIFLWDLEDFRPGSCWLRVLAKFNWKLVFYAKFKVVFMLTLVLSGLYVPQAPVPIGCSFFMYVFCLSNRRKESISLFSLVLSYSVFGPICSVWFQLLDHILDIHKYSVKICFFLIKKRQLLGTNAYDLQHNLFTTTSEYLNVCRRISSYGIFFYLSTQYSIVFHGRTNFKFIFCYQLLSLCIRAKALTFLLHVNLSMLHYPGKKILFFLGRTL